MGLSDRISRIIRANFNDMAGHFPQGEGAAFIAGGAATGAVVSETVGGMGLAVAGTAVGIGAPHAIAAGAVVGTAAYGTKKGIENRDPLALGAVAIGAAGGAGVSATIGNMGLLAAGTGFSIGMAPVAAAGAVVGLGAYGHKCVSCGEKPPKVTLEVDHKKPFSKGGSNDISNLQTLCFECNRGKGAL